MTASRGILKGVRSISDAFSNNGMKFLLGRANLGISRLLSPLARLRPGGGGDQFRCAGGAAPGAGGRRGGAGGDRKHGGTTGGFLRLDGAGRAESHGRVASPESGPGSFGTSGYVFGAFFPKSESATRAILLEKMDGWKSEGNGKRGCRISAPSQISLGPCPNHSAICLQSATIAGKAETHCMSMTELEAKGTKKPSGVPPETWRSRWTRGSSPTCAPARRSRGSCACGTSGCTLRSLESYIK